MADIDTSGVNARHPAPGTRILRASEIGQFVYCHRAWWLHRVKGVPLANVRELEAGTAGHAAHGRGVAAARALQWLALAMLVLSILALAAAMILR